jgi:hypothetical protein
VARDQDFVSAKLYVDLSRGNIPLQPASNYDEL